MCIVDSPFIICLTIVTSSFPRIFRVLTKISSCQVNTTSRWALSLVLFFFLFSFESSRGPSSQQPGKSQPLPLKDNADITNHFNDHEFPVGLITRLVKELHKYQKGHSSNSVKPEFFQASFCNCISCLFDCINCLCIYFFAAQLQFMNFIKSPLF